MITDEPHVFKTMIGLMSELDPMCYFTVNRFGMKASCQDERRRIAMNFKILPSTVSMFECYQKTNMIFITDNLRKFLKKVAKTDILTGIM